MKHSLYLLITSIGCGIILSSCQSRVKSSSFSNDTDTVNTIMESVDSTSIIEEQICTIDTTHHSIHWPQYSLYFLDCLQKARLFFGALNIFFLYLCNDICYQQIETQHEHNAFFSESFIISCLSDVARYRNSTSKAGY